MRRSPRRPLILKRRKLPFQQNDSTAAASQTQSAGASSSKEPPPTSAPAAAANPSFPDGIRIMNHPSMSDTRVVVIPRAADLQAIIGVLTAKGKESGAQGPNKFILLSDNGDRGGGSVGRAAPGGDGVPEKMDTDGRADEAETFPDATPLAGSNPLKRRTECGPLDDSLTNIQWLGKMSASPSKDDAKENDDPETEVSQARGGQTDAEAAPQPTQERPPYSYMAMIQFAINSRENKKMTLKEIYTWIEDHFPYFREVAKPGWKNSIRHNLSLHDMFLRETTADNKVSFWTIRPEVNRCLTLDQVYKPGCNPVTAPVPLQMLLYSHQQQQKRALPDTRRTPGERRIKPLLPRTESYLVPIQLPIASPVYLPPVSSSPSPAPFPPSVSVQQKQSISRPTKRVRIAPKVTKCDAPAAAAKSRDAIKAEVKEEPVCVPVTRASPRRQASSSRRKQRLVHSLHEEPVLLCPDSALFDSGVASDASTFHDAPDAEPHSPDREFSFKTPIKSGGQLTSSTPSKPPSHVAAEPWKVTPVGKGSQNLLDFSPIRTPGGPLATPRHEYNTFSFNGTPFKDWAVFSSPREPHHASASSRATGSTSEASGECQQSGCSRSLLQAGGATPANCSLAEGLVLDTMNDSLSKILVDISFSGLDDEELGVANISWSEFIPQGM